MKRVSPDEAFDLVHEQGYLYLDVRSVPEFEDGHPSGAYNVPIVHTGRFGSGPNEEFLEVLERRFDKDTAFVVGGRTSSRSSHAAALLERAGWVTVVVNEAGYAGSRDLFGRLDPGWAQRGLPVSRQAEPGHSWEDLRRGVA